MKCQINPKDLLEALSKGESNAKNARDLKRLLGCDNIRTITQLVHHSRIKGHIICSKTSGYGGYFKPNNIDEVKHFVRNFKKRILEMEKAIAPASKYLEEHLGGDVINGKEKTDI